jgi:ABC-2 type transport system permease protein
MSAIAFEWMKLRTVRSTYIALAVAVGAVVASAAWAWNVANIYDARPAGDKISMAAGAEYLVIQILPICFGVIGVLAITSEHATGMINTTLIAVPKRLLTLAGKTITAGLIALIVSLLCISAALLAGRGLVGDRPIQGYTGELTDQIPLVLGYAALVTVTALVGLGLGALLRSTAAAVVALSALLFVLPTLTTLLPAPWKAHLNAFMLPNLPGQVAGTAGSSLEPIEAACVLAAYAVVALGVGAIALVRRDA